MGSQAVCWEAQPGIWLGGSEAREVVAAENFTHVLSANGQGREASWPASVVHLALALDDEDSANLLSILPSAVAFARDARKGSHKLLIHCSQGISRSPAVLVGLCIAEGCWEGRTVAGNDACAARFAVADVLSALRAHASRAAGEQEAPAWSPNEGFEAQLELWQAMGATLDASHASYRSFILRQAALRVERGHAVALDAIPFADPLQRGKRSVADPLAKSPSLFRCRACRTAIASSAVVVEADSGGQGAAGVSPRQAFGWRKAKGASFDPPGEATAVDRGSIFVEPLTWMADAICSGQSEGKLYCPKCKSRLGTFHWAGLQDSLGRWVVPAFQLHRARLDEEPARGEGGSAAAASPAAMGVRLPRFQRPAGPPSAAPSRSETTALAKPPLPRFTHLILDCDGVMVDSERASCEALRRCLLQITGRDIPHQFPVDYYPVIGNDLRTCIAYYREHDPEMAAYGSVDQIQAQAVTVKEEIYQELTSQGLQAFEGIRELVETAKAQGLGVAIASSGRPEKIQHNLRSSGQDDLVPDELTVSAAYVKAGKPAPDVYLEALRRLGCSDASRVVVVEDAVHGIHAAKGAGCFAVGIPNTLPRDRLEPHADLVVENARELVQMLLKQA